jgi:resolvase-like protein
LEEEWRLTPDGPKIFGCSALTGAVIVPLWSRADIWPPHRALTNSRYKKLRKREKMEKRAKFAVAYLRSSSAANVGPDKDSDKRQRTAIGAFAKRAGFTIVGDYYDAAVSGADPVDKRAGFAQMLQHLAANGATSSLSHRIASRVTSRSSSRVTTC